MLCGPCISSLTASHFIVPCETLGLLLTNAVRSSTNQLSVKYEHRWSCRCRGSRYGWSLPAAFAGFELQPHSSSEIFQAFDPQATPQHGRSAYRVCPGRFELLIRKTVGVLTSIPDRCSGWYTLHNSQRLKIISRWWYGRSNYQLKWCKFWWFKISPSGQRKLNQPKRQKTINKILAY